MASISKLLLITKQQQKVTKNDSKAFICYDGRLIDVDVPFTFALHLICVKIIPKKNTWKKIQFYSNYIENKIKKYVEICAI